MSEQERHSKASEIELVSDPDVARLEARNALKQFDSVTALIEQWTAPNHPTFRLRPSILLHLQRVALDGLSPYAGNFRPSDIEIGGSRHKPPHAFLVPELVEELCDYVNANWERPPVHLAAYILWRLNWIHPFTDGNGRTARAVSYLVLCVRLGYRLPGTRTIPEQIAGNKTPYYDALEAADAGDLGPLEDLLSGHLATQLLDVHKAAVSSAADRSSIDPILH
jgi:Fic family protein